MEQSWKIISYLLQSHTLNKKKLIKKKEERFSGLKTCQINKWGAHVTKQFHCIIELIVKRFDDLPWRQALKAMWCYWWGCRVVRCLWLMTRDWRSVVQSQLKTERVQMRTVGLFSLKERFTELAVCIWAEQKVHFPESFLLKLTSPWLLFLPVGPIGAMAAAQSKHPPPPLDNASKFSSHLFVSHTTLNNILFYFMILHSYS